VIFVVQILDPSRPLSGLHAWLSSADHAHPAELIFVLAGHMSRKDYALQLFRKGLAPSLLFSVGRFEIRRFSKLALPVPLDLLKLAQDVPPPRRHFFVLFQGTECHVEHVPPTAVWHSHGDCIAGPLARCESGSPIAHSHQQRDTPAARQNVLPLSLATRCGGSAACRPKLFLGLCGPAKFCTAVHRPRPAGILQGLSLSGPANAAALSPGGWP